MPTPNWYGSLCDKLNEQAAAWNLDEKQTNELRDWTMSLCREQFKAGNRSGVTWAYEQARQKIAAGQTV